MKPRILVVGSANMDLVLSMPKMPREGESIIAGEYNFVPGGKGANTAVAASRLGADVVFCSRLGTDENGKRLYEVYNRENIDTRYIKTDKNNPTGLAAILLEEATGANRIVVCPGANMHLDADDVENAFLSYPDAVLLQFEISDEAIIKATEMAERKKIPVFIDAGPYRPDLPLEHLKNVEIISPNETEIEQLTGIAPSNADTCLNACIKLSNLVNAKNIVIKLSGRGCFVYDGKYCEFFTAHNVDAVDTTAAGDAFTAALTAEYLKTKSLSKAAKYANVVGALTVTKYGAFTSLPNSSAADDFIYRNNIKI